MALEREILLLQCSCGTPSLNVLSDQWSVVRFTNLISAAAYLDDNDPAVGIVDCVGMAEPSSNLESFITRYNGVAWISIISKEQLATKSWSLFVVSHCYDFHTIPVIEERLSVTVGHAHGMNELRSTLCLPLQKGEIIGKSEDFKEVLSQLYGCRKNCITLSGESGVGKRFLSERWAKINELTFTDLEAVTQGYSERVLDFQFNYIEEMVDNECLYVKDVDSLHYGHQEKLCDVIDSGAKYKFFIFSCCFGVDDVDDSALIVPRLKKHIKENFIIVPSLRNRGQDKVLLAKHYLMKAARRWDRRIHGFSTDAEETILRYAWPGNVPEIIERVTIGVTRCHHSYLDAESMGLGDLSKLNNEHDLSLKKAREKAEELAIKKVLDMVPGKTDKAAELLCISRSSLHRLIARYGIRR